MPVPQPKKIAMMEDHDKAYNAWKEAGVRGMTLVHVDAHIDFGWIPEMDLDEITDDRIIRSGPEKSRPLLNPFIKSRKKMVDIGNYICPAIRDGMVEKFYWVVPDDSWTSRRGKKHIIRQLKRLLKINRSSAAGLKIYERCISCRILDKEVIITSVEGLDKIDGPVLLDIDVDFMLTKHIWNDLDPGRTPWITPEELVKKLAGKVSDIDLLTIAYSVEGGFTPLRFKYLGDDLRDLFDRSVSEEAAKENAYKRDASVYFNLSLIYMDGARGSDLRASELYREAIRRDRSYATAYNNCGILYMASGKLKKAEAEYRRFLRVDKDNISALNGLGHIALSKKRYSEAGGYFDRCLTADGNHKSARLGIGIANYKSGRVKEAQEIFSRVKDDTPDDPEAYWWLGKIAQKNDQARLAIDNYKNAVIRGGDGSLVHFIMFRLYMKERLYFRAGEELKRFLYMLMSRS